MDSPDSDNATVDPAFFEGRLLVEIQTWDANLHLRLSSASTPVEYRFQGGLNYTRGFDIQGRVLAPKAHRDKPFRIWLSPFGPEMRFGPDGLDEVGQMHGAGPDPDKPDLAATLLVPETALSFAATCLGSIWKYVHLWTFDEEDKRASISAFSFSSTIHKNLGGWIADD